MYDDLEWFLILAAAAIGVAIVGGTLYRSRRGLEGRYGCLFPSLGLGALGVVGVALLLPWLDGETGLFDALLVGLPAIGLGVAVGYGFSKSDFGLGQSGSYGAGLGSLALSGVLAVGLAGPAAPQHPAASPSPAVAPSPTAVAQQPTPAATSTPVAATPAASPTPAPTLAPPSPSPSPTAAPIAARTDFFDALVEVGALTEERVDDYMDDYQLDPPADHSHATGEQPGFRPEFVDIRGHVGFSWDVDEAIAEALDALFACDGESPDGYRVQCLGTRPIFAGTWVFVNVMAAGPLPSEFGEGEIATLTIVFDDDGDPATGFMPHPAFPGDSYQGSTRWYEQVWFREHSTCLATDATRLNGGQVQRNNFMSQARFITWHMDSSGVAEYALMVPQSEVGSYYRAVIIGTLDQATFTPETTSHDYSENGAPFMFHPLETY